MCATIVCMNRLQQNALASLVAAGVLWGLTVPLSKLALHWLSPAWLTAARFMVAAPLLGVIARRELRQALTPTVLASGAVGFGGVILLQNAGIERTTVSDAAVVIGAVPVLVAILAAATGERRVPGRSWAGNLLSLAGVVLVAHLGGGGTALGDSMVLASSALSAAFVVVQPRVLAGRDAAAVTAVQFGAAATVSLPIALLADGPPAPAPSATAIAAFAALALAGTVLPFVLFAAGQARVRAEIAGAVLNLEPIVGAAVGWLDFGDHTGLAQLAGVILVLLGIAVAMNSGRGRGLPRVQANEAAASWTHEPRRAVLTGCPRRPRASSATGRGVGPARRRPGDPGLRRVVRLAAAAVPGAGGRRG